MDVLGWVLLSVGTALMVLSAVGVLRLGDIYLRMHASTKGASMGIGLVCAASVCFHAQLDVAFFALLITLFMLLTAPVAAHLIGRVAYHIGVQRVPETCADEGPRPQLRDGDP